MTALDFDVTDPSQTLVEESEKYVSIPEWVLLHKDLPPQAVRLYGVLKMYARKSGRAWPGRSTLGGHLACSEDTVDRHMKQLRDVGAIQVIYRWEEPYEVEHGTEWRITLEPGPGRRQTSNIYRLMWSPPGRTDAAPPSRKDAAPPAAAARPKAHALEAHTDEAQEKLTREGENPAHLLAKEIIQGAPASVAVPFHMLSSLLAPALANGVEPKHLKIAIKRMMQEGQRLTPWNLQEYVAKATSVSNLPFIQ